MNYFILNEKLKKNSIIAWQKECLARPTAFYRGRRRRGRVGLLRLAVGVQGYADGKTVGIVMLGYADGKAVGIDISGLRRRQCRRHRYVFFSIFHLI